MDDLFAFILVCLAAVPVAAGLARISSAFRRMGKGWIVGDRL